ncbi:RDD family protein [Mycoplasma nasistruthionis]|uniref:RDD family protein n=1 Tax=Mycoplasma nasistruthionis TaxID=353852 RepID=A0A4Y6I6B8_9MOLU|nr:RDD family protein [Mycoplasma nasistruthionis]QDF64911.1 RDD family protein [Mycoplasma nasistruthionis]
MYQNATFFRRFIANIIDLLIVLSTVIVILIISRFSNSNQTIKYYLSLSLIIFWLNFYFLIVPVLIKAKTIGLLIMKLKIINNNKQFSFLTLLKRNSLLGFYLSLLIVLTMIFIRPNDISSTQNGIKITVQFQFFQTLISTLLSIWFFIQTAGLMMLLFSKKKLTLLDYAFNSRVVIDKYIEPNDQKHIILIPYYYHERKFYYFKGD